MSRVDELHISSSPHLQSLLEQIFPLLPPELRAEITPCLSISPNDDDDAKIPAIPYHLLLALSRWSRLPTSRNLLEAASPPIKPSSYSMINLLAGCTTSPNSHFPPHVSAEEKDRTESRQMTEERKAIATRINAMFSVVGSGVAAWWAAGVQGWAVEWVSFLHVIHSLWPGDDLAWYWIAENAFGIRTCTHRCFI